MSNRVSWDESDRELDEAFLEEDFLPEEDDPFVQLRMRNASLSPMMQLLDQHDELLGPCCRYLGHGCLCELCTAKLEKYIAFAKMRTTASYWRRMKRSGYHCSCGGCVYHRESPMCYGCTVWLAAKEAHEEWERRRLAFKYLRRTYRQRCRDWNGMQRRLRR